jgi:hypothetical protein
VTQVWTREDTEAVTCCVCHREGRPIYDLDPFGVVRCPRCSIVFVSPRLVPEAAKRMYDDTAYFVGDRSVYGPDDRFAPAMILQRLWTSGRLALAARESARPPSGSRLLEIGCARGLFLAAARRRGYDVTGVEPSTAAAAYARDRLGLTVHATQLADAPVDGRFDVVCAWDTIEHVPDPVEFWRAVRPLVADDGVVLFSRRTSRRCLPGCCVAGGGRSSRPSTSGTSRRGRTGPSPRRPACRSRAPSVVRSTARTSAGWTRWSASPARPPPRHERTVHRVRGRRGRRQVDAGAAGRRVAARART